LEHIYWLIDDINNLNSNIKRQINEATKNAAIPTINNKQLYGGNIYYVIRGFLLLCWEPIYTIRDILIMITNEGASDKAISMTGSLIGAYVGLKDLQKKHDLIITFPLMKSINTYLEKMTLIK
jgi:hypothetical protein